DLSWNPTRHEQREGRVDRYGQPDPIVRTLTYYGLDNQIDGVVLEVLLRKHRAIRNSLGISVPVPVDTNQVIEAIFEGLLLREQTSVLTQYLPGFESYIKPQKEELFTRWEAAQEREKRSRTMFAQETIKVQDVARELRAAQAAVGSGVDVAAFVRDALHAHGAAIQSNGALKAELNDVPFALRETLGNVDRFEARFELPLRQGQVLLTRTHPTVEGLATYVMDTALDPLGEGVARRCGVIRTRAVERRTTALLVRFRFHLMTRRIVEGQARDLPLLAEDCRVLAFAGSPQNAEWLDEEQAEALLQATPDENIAPEQAMDFLRKVIDGFESVRPHLNDAAQRRGEELLDAHQRVREAAHLKGIRYRVEPQLPPDMLGMYVYLPAGR
ncbi:MAG: helicase-related protein, partial [Anaerolineales bacterium]